MHVRRSVTAARTLVIAVLSAPLYSAPGSAAAPARSDVAPLGSHGLQATPEPATTALPEARVGAEILSFEDGNLGLLLGTGYVPASWSCAAPELGGEGDRPGFASLATLPGGGRALRLATGPAELDGPDGLGRTYWRLRFHVAEPAILDLNYAFASRDRPENGDHFAILLDGRPIACGDTRSLEEAPAGTFASVASPLRLTALGAGTHTLEAMVGDGGHTGGASTLTIGDLRLKPDPEAVAGACRPEPPEALGEIRYIPPGGANPTLWTFDDNKFCSSGPGVPCQRMNGNELQDPNPGIGFVDSTNRSFEMYIVADCGTEMHLPLFDVESGCISVFDQNRNPIAITVKNGAGFNGSGGEVCWGASDCSGQGDPGGPGDGLVMDVRFAGKPTLCGVFIINFRSWAGCIWDLFANCTGTDSEEFDIYDDFCVAEGKFNPLPELVLSNLTTSDAGDCTVDYCVTVQNIGCSGVNGAVVRVANGVGTDDHTVNLAPGASKTLCGNLPVGGTGTKNTVVTATADPASKVSECSESNGGSACKPAAGSNKLSRTQSIQCSSAPTCKAGGPYAAACIAPGPTALVLDGTGSSDPDGGQLAFAWSTDCPGTLDDPTAPTPTLTIPGTPCVLACTVALTVTDPTGLQSSCSAPVEVRDTTPPSLVAPADLAIACPAGGPAPTPDEDAWRLSATAADACTGARVETLEIERLADCGNSYHATFEFWAVDDCGNQSAHVQRTFRTLDLADPVVLPPADLAVECPAPTSGPLSPGGWRAGVSCADIPDCSGCTPAVGSPVLVAGCGGTYEESVEMWALDGCGRESAHVTASYSVVDTTAPDLIGLPADQTVDCLAVPGAPVVTATDACEAPPAVTFNETRNGGSCPGTFTLDWSWSATDSCGNVATAIRTVRVVDSKAPVLAGIPADQTAECSAVPAPAVPTASDDCSAPVSISLLETTLPGACSSSYTLERTWTATDLCGNSSSATQRIAVSDTIRPTLQGVPADDTVECDAIPAPAVVTAKDNCDPTPQVTLLETVVPGTCPASYTLLREWTARDACGNTTALTQTIRVVDTTKPTLAGIPADAIVECDAVPAPAAVTASDNCGAPSLTFAEVRGDGSCLDSYTLKRTWTAVDSCGLMTSATQTLTVVDTKKPILSGVPADATVACDSVPAPAAVTASDNCDQDPTLTFVEVRSDGSCLDSYTLKRTWTVVDNCGLVTAATQTLTVVDTTKPVLRGVPADATVECDAVPAPAAVTASDNCDQDPTLTFNEVRSDGSCLDSYTLERTWTVVDNCGLVTTATQTLTVVDTTKPVLSGVPADATVECDAVPAPAAVTASDNCDQDPTLNFAEVRSDGSCLDSYTLRRTWSVVDNCGLVTTATQTLTVVDTTQPVLLGVPTDATVACDAVPAPAAVTASDNCDQDPTLTFNEVRSDGPCLDSYTLSRTWTATDRCGNATTATQTVTVVDTTAPIPEALLQPLLPAGPSSPASPAPPRSACSSPSSGRFQVLCAASDTCDPAPHLEAVLRVRYHQVEEKNGPCVAVEEKVSVICGETVELVLVAPPCPAKPPRSPVSAVSVNSEGIQVVTGESIVLEVRARDRCGNEAVATFDPASEPAPGCVETAEEPCCPLLEPPPPPECKVPVCGEGPLAARAPSGPS